MNEGIKLFLEKVSQDEELVARLQEAKTPDEAYAIASEVASGFTQEEFVETAKMIRDSVMSQDLTEEDLALIAGGMSDKAACSLAISIGGPTFMTAMYALVAAL